MKHHALISRVRIAIIIAGLGVTSTAAAEDPLGFPEISLRGAVTDTISVSPLLKAAQAQVRAADAAVQQSRASIFPKLSASLGDDRIWGGRRSSNDNTGSDGRVGLSMQWTLFDGFQSHFASQSAALARDSARYSADAVRNDLQLEMLDAYLRFIEAEKTTDLIKTNIISVKRLLAAIQARKEGGFSSTSDVDRINADIALLSQELVSAQTSAEIARLKVSSLVGRPVKLLSDLPDLRKHLTAGPQQMINHATAKNPRVRAARVSAEAADYSAQAAKGKYLPQLNLTGSYTYDIGGNVNTKNAEDDWKIGLQLSVPLVDVATMADVARSQEMATVAHFQSLDRLREVTLEIETLWRQYDSGTKRLNLVNRQVNAQNDVLLSSQEQFKLGLLTLDEVLTQRRNVISARQAKNRIEFEQYLTACRLLLVAGLFQPDMLGF